MPDKTQRQRALEMHNRMLAGQRRRYHNRFTMRDGDYRDQQEIRDKLDDANDRRIADELQTP